MNSNIEYYNNNSKEFIENTINSDMSLWRDKFEKYIPDGGHILDAGCGSGRDSKAFLKHGYSVVAFDASREMCKFASEYLGFEVWQMRFDEICFDEEFDGVWACASLLHVDADKIADAMNNIKNALKDNGVIYASFKYGDGTTSKGDRSFTNMNEEGIAQLMDGCGFEILEYDISQDVRPDRNDEKWINVIARK